VSYGASSSHTKQIVRAWFGLSLAIFGDVSLRDTHYDLVESGVLVDAVIRLERIDHRFGRAADRDMFVRPERQEKFLASPLTGKKHGCWIEPKRGDVGKWGNTNNDRDAEARCFTLTSERSVLLCA